MHKARLPLYEIEGRAFTVHVTANDDAEANVPWYEIVTEVRSPRVMTANGCQRAAKIQKDNAPRGAQPAAEEEPKGNKSIKESMKKAVDAVEGVGEEGKSKADLSDGERLASPSKRPTVSLFRACLQLTVSAGRRPPALGADGGQLAPPCHRRPAVQRCKNPRNPAAWC